MIKALFEKFGFNVSNIFSDVDTQDSFLNVSILHCRYLFLFGAMLDQIEKDQLKKDPKRKNATFYQQINIYREKIEQECVRRNVKLSFFTLQNGFTADFFRVELVLGSKASYNLPGKTKRIRVPSFSSSIYTPPLPMHDWSERDLKFWRSACRSLLFKSIKMNPEIRFYIKHIKWKCSRQLRKNRFSTRDNMVFSPVLN